MTGRDDHAAAVAAEVSAQPASAIHVLAAVEGTALVERSLEPAFEELLRHNRSKLVSLDPPTVSGTAPVGGYLATLERTSRPASSGFEAVQVRLRVLEGSIGVGLLDGSGSTFLDSVDGFGPGDVPALTFLVRGIQDVGPLVIRNAGHGQAVFALLAVDCFQLKGAAEIVDGHVFPEAVTPFAGWNRYYGRFAATPAEGVRQLFYDQLRDPMVMHWRHELQVVITPRDETSRALFVSGAYEPASTLALQQLLMPGAVLFDVGANVGVYTLIGSGRVGASGHVYSFEPSVRERSTLEKNVTLNNCQNVTVIAAAVGERVGTGTLRVAAGRHRGQNTFAPAFAYPSVSLEREEPVSVVSLDELWRGKIVRQPDVLKIDAEGSELGVLRGAVSLLRESMPAVMFEINDTLLEASGASRAKVEEFLKGLAYTFYRVDDATAALMPVTTLAGVESENFIALPSHKAV